MQNIVKEEKDKLKNRIKNFLEKNRISFKETQKEIKVKCKIKSIEITPYEKIEFELPQNKRIIVKDFVEKIEIYANSKIQISRSNLLLIDFRIYFEKNKLVFKF